jgi:hypothetical protein
MLPYTTYKIPEEIADVTNVGDKWLWYVIPEEATPNQKELFEKMTSALEGDYAKDAVCIVVHKNQQLSMEHLNDHHPRLIICMGVSPHQMGMWVEAPSSGIRFLEKYALITAPAPAILMQDLNAKKDLWKHMQMYLGR